MTDYGRNSRKQVLQEQDPIDVGWLVGSSSSSRFRLERERMRQWLSACAHRRTCRPARDRVEVEAMQEFFQLMFLENFLLDCGFLLNQHDVQPVARLPHLAVVERHAAGDRAEERGTCRCRCGR